MKTASEEVSLNGDELYVYYPNGIGRSKLTGASLEKALETSGTARNWNSVTNILASMERIPPPEPEGKGDACAVMFPKSS